MTILKAADLIMRILTQMYTNKNIYSDQCNCQKDFKLQIESESYRTYCIPILNQDM